MKEIFVLFAVGVYAVFCEDDSNSIAFPEMPNQTLDSEKGTGRVPLFAPKKCPKNQWLYPGNQKEDWICDCKPGFVYYPPSDECFHAYKQGPCPEGQHLILKKGKVVPDCVENPCRDGFARFEDRCYEMGKPNGPCEPFEAGGGIFDVNATTLLVECLIGTDRLSLLRICPPGSIRDNNNKCVNKCQD